MNNWCVGFFLKYIIKKSNVGHPAAYQYEVFILIERLQFNLKKKVFWLIFLWKDFTIIYV